MKKLKTIIASAALLVGLAFVVSGCNDESTDASYTYSATVDKGSVSFEKNDKYGQVVTVTTEAPVWAAVPSDMSWISTSVVGNDVTIMVAENTGAGQRSGHVTISGKDLEPKTISVTQTTTEGKFLYTDDASFTFDANSGMMEIPIVTNATDWQATVIEGTDWNLKVEKVDNSSIRVSVPENWDTTERIGKISFTSPSISNRTHVISIVQELFPEDHIVDMYTTVEISGEATGHFTLMWYEPTDDSRLVVEGYANEDGLVGEYEVRQFIIKPVGTPFTIVPGAENDIHAYSGSLEERNYSIGRYKDVPNELHVITRGTMYIEEVAIENGESVYSIRCNFTGDFLHFDTHFTRKETFRYVFEGVLSEYSGE